MIVKNNYNECLTNLACSIAKYFGASYKHNTIDYIDKLLEEKNPKNVVTILLDGMGSSILNKHLSKNSFFMKHKLKDITTVFPATTVAATTSMRTGLNPCETGMLGWTMYFDDLDKIIVTFANTEKGDETWTVIDESIEYKNKYLKHKEVTDRINEETEYEGYRVTPFYEDAYQNIDEMYEKIEILCNKENKKYIYAYNDEPDHTMHDLGTDSDLIKKIIIKRENKIHNLAKKLKDTIIFVVADHGHLNEEDIFLKEYPDFLECLKRYPSIEPRATTFFVKDGMKSNFENLFDKYFKCYFDLYTKEDVIKSGLFGDGEENPKFRSQLGDYLAISHTKKAFIYDGDSPLSSQHAGYTDEELYVPLIIIDTNEENN